MFATSQSRRVIQKGQWTTLQKKTRVVLISGNSGLNKSLVQLNFHCTSRFPFINKLLICDVSRFWKTFSPFKLLLCAVCLNSTDMDAEFYDIFIISCFIQPEREADESCMFVELK